VKTYVYRCPERANKAYRDEILLSVPDEVLEPPRDIWVMVGDLTNPVTLEHVLYVPVTGSDGKSFVIPTATKHLVHQEQMIAALDKVLAEIRTLVASIDRWPFVRMSTIRRTAGRLGDAMKSAYKSAGGKAP
jgi:hypothetical protein